MPQAVIMQYSTEYIKGAVNDATIGEIQAFVRTSAYNGGGRESMEE